MVYRALVIARYHADGGAPGRQAPRPTAESVIRDLATKLERQGHVKPSFAQAALEREKRSPTGLPFDPPAVALPHADPEHVLTPAIAVAALVEPVAFREMGSPSGTVDARIVVMPALTAKEQAAAALSEIVEMLQDDALRAALADAPTDDVLYDLLSARWRR